MANLAKILTIPIRGHEAPAPRPLAPSRNERRARWVFAAALVGALGLYWGGAALSLREEAAGLRELPTEARRGVYTRTLSEVETICREEAAGAGNLRDHCLAQARFVLQFPECAEGCRRAALIVLPHARR